VPPRKRSLRNLRRAPVAVPLQRRLVAALAITTVVTSSAEGVTAQTSGLHLLAPSVSSFAIDGTRYAAWQTRETSPLTVLDTSTGRRRRLPLPNRCRLVSDEGSSVGFGHAAADGRVLIECASNEQLPAELTLNVRTGAMRALPRGGGWFTLGTYYARGNNEKDHQVVVDLATGKVKRVSEVEYRELNRPGAPRVCPALRGEGKRQEVPINGEFSYEGDLFAKSVGSHGAVRLKLCDGSSIVLPSRRGRVGKPLFFDLRSGLISWDTAVQQWYGFREGGDRLDVYNMKTRRHEEWTLPNLAIPGPEGPDKAPGYAAGWSTHTANAVFWLPDRELECEKTCSVETLYIYEARL
jgi:hypothetical protein